MISLSKIYYDFLKYNNSSELLELHSIPYNNYDSIPNKFLSVLENYLEDNELNREQLRILTSMEIEHVSVLMAVANYIRRRKKGDLISFSKNVFIPLTQLCRDQCSYCTFKIEPGEGELLVPPEKVLDSARKAAKAGCTELLFVSGDKPEIVYDVYKDKLKSMGYDSTADYMISMSEICLEENIFPHSNLGIANQSELKRFRKSNPSMGLMLENISERLMKPGMAHHKCPDKYPKARINTINTAGELKIPWTSGILIGIGENWDERIDSILELRKINNLYGHIQEIIIQNFSPKPGIKMEGHPVPTDLDMIKTVALSKLIMGDAVSIQVPPNLNSKSYMLHVFSGVSDLGGVSPLTIDFVNPESPWPQIEIMKKTLNEFGFTLRERLPVYPAYLKSEFIEDHIYQRAIKFVDETGFVAEN
jgi:FO synthase subunit 1